MRDILLGQTDNAIAVLDKQQSLKKRKVLEVEKTIHKLVFSSDLDGIDYDSSTFDK